MKINKTAVFALITLSLTAFVYFYEYKDSVEREKAEQSEILQFDITQISYFQIIKPDLKIAFQKNEKGWQLIEPIFEDADSQKVEELLTVLSTETPEATVKTTETTFSEPELSEYGLDKPAITFVFKNNAGLTRKISVGSVRNNENQSYLQVDSGNRIILGGTTWSTRAQDNLIYYRDKRLFRDSMANVKRIAIKSLNENIEIKRVDNKWVAGQTSHELDQAQIRDILRKISDSQIEEYVFEGEPSQTLLKEKGLDNPAVTIELFTDSSSWLAKLSSNTKDRKLYLLSDRPTYLAQVNPLVWEAVAGLTNDSLRDRVTAFAFNAEEVKKIYFKNNDKETNLIFNSGAWLMGSTNSPYLEVDKAEISKTIKNIHNLKISEFIDENVKDKFVGQNMLILKSDTEKLVLQLNWGPSFKLKKDGEEKEYFYARTHLSDSIFALDAEIITNLNLSSDKVKRKTETIEKPDETQLAEPTVKAEN
jgi:hypothetical protein